MAHRIKHHFVPRFYLKAFASAEKRINIYNLHHNKAIQNGSLRDQCYKDRFYGDDELEQTLGVIEGYTAPVLSQIIQESSLPRKGTEEQLLLRLFVVLQLGRTSQAANRSTEMVNKLMHNVAKDFDLEDYDPDDLRFSFENPVLLPLSTAMEFGPNAISDLEINLVIAEEHQSFFTSDNPVILYNQYCEGAKDIGTTGLLNRGIQIFLPLSPKHMLIFYDKEVYKVRNRNSDITTSILDEDVFRLNLLQAINADANLYFSDWNSVRDVIKIAQGVVRYRRMERVKIQEFEEVRNQTQDVDSSTYSVLVQVYRNNPQVSLNFSFLSILRKARKVPLIERAFLYRADLNTILPEYNSPQGLGERKRFFRRIAK